MVDAIAAVMSMEDKEFYKVGELAVAVMIETASAITGDPYKVSIVAERIKTRRMDNHLRKRTHWASVQCRQSFIFLVF